MKKLLALLFVAVITAALLISCGSTDSEQGKDKERVDYGTATVFAPGDTVQLIAPSSTGRTFADNLSVNLRQMLTSKGRVLIGSAYSENEPLEIVIGYQDDSRPATQTAYRLLERIERESYFRMRYLVYASSGMIVIAYDDNEYTNLQVLEVIGDKLIEVLTSDKQYIALPEGVVLSGTVDLISEQEDLDRIQLDQEWAALESVVGEEATAAFRTLYTMYDDRMILWAANLYDPGVGGFYTCTSGRNGDEFGPDVEGTVQLIKFFAQSGMVKNISTDWVHFLPKSMQQQLIYFGKSLQHTNGYFYHPQWSKEDVDSHLSRRGRDLGWATSLLSGLDSAPPYKAANGTAGDGITADEYWDNLIANGEALSARPYPATESPKYSDMIGGATLTSQLGSNASVAVSKVVLTSETNPDDPEVETSTEYLNSYTSFINYLLTKVGPTYDSNPYSMGNTMNATRSQIEIKSSELSAKYGAYSYAAGDELTCTNPNEALVQLKVNTDSDSSNDLTLAEVYQVFDGMTLRDMVIFMLNEKINPEIGLWGKTSEKNPTGTEFLFTNGYFKTIGTYNSWKVSYPPEYIALAANALMQGLLGDQPSTTNICEVFNIWSSICALKSNLKYVDPTIMATDSEGNPICSADGRQLTLSEYIRAEVDNILHTNMAAAVLNSYNKVSGYKKPDGGFDHQYVRTGGGYATQQGLPTGYRLNDQSNVDATCIGSTGLTREIFEAFGLSSYKISLHTESDWMRALEVFFSQSPVIKYSESDEFTNSEYHDYEADIPGTNYLKVTNNNVAANTFEQTKLGDRGVGLFNKTDDTKQMYLDWKVNTSSPVANTAIFETEIMFDDLVAAKDAIELRFYNGKSSSSDRIYSLYFYADKLDDGTAVSIAPKSAKSERVEVGKVGEWIKISLVYCEAIGSGEEAIPACFKVYVNDNPTPVIVDYKFETVVEAGVAAKTVEFARFISMKAFMGKIYLDNTKFSHESKTIVKDAATHNGDPTGEAPDTSDQTGTSKPLPSTGCTLGAKDGVLTFDNLTAFPINYDNGFIIENKSKDSWSGFVSAEKEGDNTFLRLNDLLQASNGESGQPIININLPTSIGSGDTFVVEAKFRVSALADGSLVNNAVYLLDLTLRDAKGTRVYQNYFGKNSFALNSDSDNAVKDVYVTGEWFSVRLEYSVVGDSADTASWNVKAYINDALVMESTEKTAQSAFADSASIKTVSIVGSKNFVGCLDIDDIKIYRK